MEPLEKDWVVTEFAGAELGDERRTERLVEIATVLAEYPQASFPKACGERAFLKALYRFFDTEEIEPDEILAPHVAATLTRAATQKVVLSVQDTTQFDFTHHSSTQGLGPLSNPNYSGFFAHTTLCITPERVPLGLLSQQVWTRDPHQVGKRHTRKVHPITHKESYKWVTGLQATIEARAFCDQTTFINVADREADVYDLFLEERPEGVEWLIRAAWNRRVDHPERYLWDCILAQPIQTTLTLEVPRREKWPARKALLSLRFCPITLCPPHYRSQQGLPKVQVWAIGLFELSVPEGVEPIEWLLLTTCAVETLQDALERVKWYTCLPVADRSMGD